MLSPESVESIKRIGLDEGIPKEKEGNYIRQGFLDIFMELSNAAKIGNSPAQTIIVPMARPGGVILPGHYMAELHFVVRKVIDDSDNGNEEEQEAAPEGTS